MRKDYLTTFLAAGFFFAGAFFATFFAGAFLTIAFLVAFFAGAFLAGISYPPFHSAVAEDKTQITIGLTNERRDHFLWYCIRLKSQTIEASTSADIWFSHTTIAEVPREYEHLP